MSISVGQNSSVAGQTSGAELLTAALAKRQQEVEGKMALQLIQSASVSNLPAPSGNSGFNVNIKV
jgi:thiazole synthase ThiGH ThiG subunit